MKNLKSNEIQEYISKGNSAIDFWATWCGPCQMLGPVFEEISTELKDINFAKADVDEAGEAATELGIRGVPTIVLFKDGKELTRIVGALPKDALKNKIQETFN